MQAPKPLNPPTTRISYKSEMSISEHPPETSQRARATHFSCKTRSVQLARNRILSLSEKKNKNRFFPSLTNGAIVLTQKFFILVEKSS